MLILEEIKKDKTQEELNKVNAKAKEIEEKLKILEEEMNDALLKKDKEKLKKVIVSAYDFVIEIAQAKIGMFLFAKGMVDKISIGVGLLIPFIGILNAIITLATWKEYRHIVEQLKNTFESLKLRREQVEKSSPDELLRENTIKAHIRNIQNYINTIDKQVKLAFKTQSFVLANEYLGKVFNAIIDLLTRMAEAIKSLFEGAIKTVETVGKILPFIVVGLIIGGGFIIYNLIRRQVE